MKKISLEDIIATIEGAFSPLRCVAESCDYGNAVRFRVFGADDKPIANMDHVAVSRLRDPNGLKAAIEGARDFIERRGHSLSPWAMPDNV